MLHLIMRLFVDTFSIFFAMRFEYLVCFLYFRFLQFVSMLLNIFSID